MGVSAADDVPTDCSNAVHRRLRALLSASRKLRGLRQRGFAHPAPVAAWHGLRLRPRIPALGLDRPSLLKLTFEALNLGGSLIQFRMKLIELRCCRLELRSSRLCLIRRLFSAIEFAFHCFVMFSCRGRLVNVFAITYPVAKRSLFDPVVERMEDTFRPGRVCIS